MSNPMVILIVKSKDALLRERFSHFQECARQSIASGISFQERVAILERMGEWSENVAKRIAVLSGEGISVDHVPESLLHEIGDMGLRNRLSNGLFSQSEWNGLLQHSCHKLPDSLIGVYGKLTAQLNDEEFILFWNLGELEANDLLSH